MTVLLLKFAPWIAGMIVLLGLGGYIGYHLNPYPERYKDLVATQALDQADAEEAVRKTLTAQLVQAQTQTKANSDAMLSLAQENAQIAHDRDATVTRVRRLEQLLAAASTRASKSGGMSQTGSGPAAAGTGGAGGLTEVERLLVDAREEAERNADRLDTLIAEVTAQVQP